MCYTAVILKEKTNSKTITLRAKSKEDIEEMMPRIKSFLYPDEDASGCRYLIWTHEVEAYSPGVKIPEYQVTVYKPEEKKVVEGFEDWEDDEAPCDDGCWYEEIIEAESLEEAREKMMAKDCPYQNVGYDECLVYINEVSVSMLLEEAKHSLVSRVENAYIDAKRHEMTVREYHQIHRDMEQSEKLQYEALKYMRSVFAVASCLDRAKFDLKKMSAKKYIDLLTQLPLLNDDRDAWNRMFEEAKRKYGKDEKED